jgi:hypothetical protein
MHSSRLSLKFYMVVVLFAACSLGIHAQDTLRSTLDTSVAHVKETKLKTYKNTLFITAFLADSKNASFYNNTFYRGYGLQLGIPLYTHQYYTTRLNLSFASFKFQTSEYLKSITLKPEESISSKDLETFGVIPDIMIHPLGESRFSPFVNLGAGLIVGSREPNLILKNNATGKESTSKITLGSRFVAQVGAGLSVKTTSFLFVTFNATYNIEFLRNNQPEDIFNKFKKEKDLSYKYMYYSIGLQLKLKRN